MAASLLSLAPVGGAEAARAARVEAARPAAKAAAPARPATAAPRAAAKATIVAARGAPPARGRAVTRQVSARGGSAGAVPYARQHAAPHPLRQAAMASCTHRQGRRVCGPVVRTVSFRWSQGGGMPAPSLAQTACPDGTIATHALGHADVVRCVPL